MEWNRMEWNQWIESSNGMNGMMVCNGIESND